MLGPPRLVDTLLVHGRVVVAGRELRTADAAELGREAARASRLLAERAAA